MNIGASHHHAGAPEPLRTTAAAPTTQSSKATGGGGCGSHVQPTGPAGTDALGGAAQLNTDNALQTALSRLTDAVNELKRVVEQFARSVAGGGGSTAGASGAPMKTSANTVGQTGFGTGTSPVQGSGASPTSATSRTSAIPDLQPGQTEQLRLARNQVTYREITVPGGSTFTPPTAVNGLSVEVYALRDYQSGAHSTQVLEPVAGPVTVPAGETAKFVVRVRGDAPGSHTLDVGGARMTIDVGSQAVDALPMMAWINESDAKGRGANGQSLASVLSHFGVAATGNSGVAVTSASNKSPVQYFSAAYEAATRSSPAETAKRIVEAERKAQAANPGSEFWVQVSDEQDTTASAAQGTTAWISELRSHLAGYGSSSKLFVAAQARPHNLVYASVIDGWATTQSAAGRDRSTAINDIKQASSAYGRNIELLEYPGNAFFDGRTPGGAAISTASAALDGASGWFVYSTNNQAVLEKGGGDEGHGDIGGLVVVENGRVLPTIALMEAELGANLGSAARTFGATATSGAQQVASTSDQLDAYRHSGGVVDLRTWEQQIGARVS